MMRRVARVAALAGIVAVLVTAVVVYAARAKALALAESVGDALATVAEQSRLETARALHINGLWLHLSTRTTGEPIARVLAAHERACRYSLHTGNERKAQLVCLRADLAIELVRAERGASGTTFVLRVWSDERLQLARAFPSQGDAPGRDLDAFPRPPRSRRVLSAAHEGGTGSVGIYRSPSGASGMRLEYRELLERDGFSLLEAPARSSRTRHALIARRGARDVVVVIAPDTADSSLVLVAPL